MTTSARNLGTTRYLIGLRAMVSSASICSVTFMLPSSAVIAAPTLPAITRAVSTGPNSLHMETLTKAATYTVAPSLES